MKIRNLVATALVLAIASHGTLAMAAFIVEPFGQKAPGNFSSPDGPPNTSVAGTAVGLTPGASSALGGTIGSVPNVNGWIFEYTPGQDPDNTVFAGGTPLGTATMTPPNTVTPDVHLSSGLQGGISGVYNVYITWPASGNVAANATVTITSDLPDIVLNPVDQNSTTPNGPTDSGVGGANQWMLIGTVPLTQNQTYSVTMTANSSAFVAQRASGVMWELIPEPSSFMLCALGLAGVAGFRRRKA